MPNYKINLQHLADVEAYVSVPYPVGPSSWGTRLIFPVVEGGTVKGERLNGKILPFGADWGLVRVDNNFELDVRVLMETDDGALIHSSYRGIAAMTDEQAAGFLAGEPPKGVDLYTTPRFETSHEEYQWLTQVQVVGRGGAEPAGDRVKVSYSWYILGS